MDLGWVREHVFAKDVNFPRLLIFCTGGFIALAVLGYLSFDLGYSLMVASFGSSVAVIYGMPGSPAARPKCVFFSHLMAAIISVVVYATMGLTWYSASFSVALTVFLMAVTDTMHPPAGATAVFGVLSAADWDYVVAPVMLGVVVLIVFGYATLKVYEGYLEHVSGSERKA